MADKTGEPAESTALAVAEQRTIQLDEGGSDVLAVRVTTGEIYVSIRSLCAALGLDSTGQIQRIRRRQVLAEMLQTIVVPTAGGNQPLVCLDLEGLPLWLAGVEEKRVRNDLRERLMAYQRWARRRIYEAFLAETGIGALPTTETTVTPVAETASALDQIEAFGSALMTFARQQRDFEQRYQSDQEIVLTRLDHLDNRLDRAAQAFAHLVRDVQVRLDGSDVITDAQASDIKALVQAIAKDKTTPEDKSGNQYRALWSELYRRFRVPSYARIKQVQYQEVIEWLESLRGPAESQGHMLEGEPS